MQRLQIRPHNATAGVHYLHIQIQWRDTTGEHLQEKCAVTSKSADGTITEVTVCLWTVLVSLLVSRLIFFRRLTFFTKEETKQ